MTQVKFNGRPVAKNYDQFFNDFFNLPSVWSNPSRDIASIPAANVYETPKSYHLEINAPGRNKEDFRINVEKDLLTVSYEKQEEKVADDVTAVRREFNFNSFKRNFSLDEKIDVSNIQAKYENGILKIELAKKEQFKVEPRQITIS